MEEIKILVDMVAHLPSMALWVIAAFWAYKVVVIGSIYGVIRLAIVKTHSWLTTPQVELKEVRPMLEGLCIGGTEEGLVAQLRRIAGKNTGIQSKYIHSTSVDWLREAIDDKIAKDQAQEK